MSLLWTSDAMLEAMNGRPVGTLPEGITGISIDTRTLKEGEAFFAIKGDALDGHDYATAAVAAGAALLVVAEAKLPALGKLKAPLIVVDDVLAALTRLGIASRERSHAQIIAVTGSVGKTTTKEALRHVLADCGKVHASVASFNNHWGVPLTLARMPGDTDFGVFEIGMNHPDEIRPLVKMVRPHVALITLIAAAHLGQFKNLQEIAAAKAEIFEGLVPGGYALLNRDDKYFKSLEKMAFAAGVEHIKSFGESRLADYRLMKLKLHDECSCMTARLDGEEVVAKVGAPGRHIVQNVLAVLGAAHLTGADMAKAVLALASLRAEGGRGERHVLEIGRGTFTLIDESYNANPASMRAAVELLAAAKPAGNGRRIAVLGDMLELGKHSARLHAELSAVISDNKIDMVFLGGPEMQALKTAMPVDIHAEYRQSVEELQPQLLKTIRAGDVIMVKSSKGTGFSRIVKTLLQKYNAAAPLAPAE
ncbi:UDP-N-acetylmuramoylalanyl-D-glutamyl-2,6-diaminopimelate--D-alanyl-D-alanine ligase [Phyllobacterium sp. 0TCS1.6C]|uniref:UDP-N-acetylmuramoylalanyl-D-glutamyl-2, 6-diaminopimelate--D-alanyl-D-alanine ligase n=1 Tax=unclassified Phyllobacterium TaxID=2638441 RepID=UPI0022655143|nr:MULTISPECIES: UDP-N-acetylmuramoylalanyl-D-glutamyl-2,6-diaminopimelate--D-alanyl-D-alanine ligase [unclassified Phyllobacterium]MCX8279606.1 UDP-N-acetylmuramoylalanyl-D-glutamyl-2,6-diaminopimelate--D-alanyl-D-alanine ligase [Phyllobacterium sp. 0TCS1.6C]MCX8292203.1 UDP-N-acetylmuramoylalanyl-D-glutamyl-2,6-diaminopimelate--D-alanyl-D-alanine ligase [Phyllobacterium sp. 0TCS1.6A]